MTDIIDQAAALEEKMRDYWLVRHKEAAADAPSAQECEECGEIIPEARRLAVPGCRLCIDCRREKVVIDNPPFSISSEIINFYYAHGIPFFLFAPRMTCLSGRRAGMENLTAVFGCKDISYENGAVVPTAFLTNMMGDVKIRVSETLEAKLKAAMPSEKKALPRYAYPDNLIKAADLEQCGELEICRADTLPVNALDAQKPFGKTVFGKGLLLSDKAARAVKAVKAAKAARAAKAAKAANVIVWPLSEREQKLIERLNR